MPDITTGIQTREFTALSLATRDAPEDGMIVAGIGVPYDVETELYDGLFESLAPGAVTDRAHRLLYYRHRDPIGTVISESNAPDGWHHESRISDTPTGREAYTLARDGVIRSFSIGFTPIEWEETRDETGLHIRHTKIDVREVSLVPVPAYEAAALTEIRHHTHKKGSTMPEQDPTQIDVTEFRQSVEDLTREINLLKTTGIHPAPAPAPLTRSFGDLVKRVAAGDETVTRAYTGAVAADTIMHDSWIGSLVEIVKKRQIVASTFARGAVPATGMTVEYAVLKDDTTQVGVQAGEGDDLLFGKVAIELKTAAIKTLGGYSTLSRQAIERSDVGILDTTFQALYEKASRAVELLARTALTAGIAAADEVIGDLTTQIGIVSVILDLVERYDDLGLSLDGLFVDKASFLALYAVQADDRLLQISGAPSDKVGSLNVTTASGDIASVPFRVLPGATAGTVVAYDKSAIKTLESGMPRLQDENIVNLTKDFSVYLYGSSFVQRPAALAKVVAD